MMGLAARYADNISAKLGQAMHGQRFFAQEDKLPQNVRLDCDLTAPGTDERQPAPNLNGRRLLAEETAIHALPLDLERTEQRESGRPAAVNCNPVTDLTNTKTPIGAPCAGERQGGTPEVLPAFTTPAGC